MSPTPIIKGRGRQPQHPVDLLRTRFWFHIVKARSGLPTAYAVELLFDPEFVTRSADGVNRPSKWKGYENGDHVPQRIAGKKYAVDVAEVHLPGTSWYFDSPLWRVLKGEKLTAIETERYLRSFKDPIAAVLLTQAPRTGESDWRLGDFDEASALELAQIASFDALTAVVLLIARSEAIASPHLRDLAFQSYIAMQQLLQDCPDLGPFLKEIIWEIDANCKQWIFPTTQSRLEIVIFSQEVDAFLARQADGLDTGDSQA